MILWIKVENLSLNYLYFSCLSGVQIRLGRLTRNCNIQHEMALHFTDLSLVTLWLGMIPLGKLLIFYGKIYIF